MKRIKTVAAGLGVLALAGCGTYADTASDTVAVAETGSVIWPTARETKEQCIGPSTNTNIGMGDAAYIYPAGRRTLRFANEETADIPAITVTTKGDQQVTLTGTLAFTLKTDCPTLNKFHELQGRKNWVEGRPAYIAVQGGDVSLPEGNNFAGWDAMLDNLIGGPLNTVAVAKGPAFETLPLWRDEAQRVALADEIEKTLPGVVERFAGGDFFQINSLEIERATPPEGMLNALDRQAAAVEEREAIEQENLAAAERYTTIRTCMETDERMTVDTCEFLYAVDSGKVAAVVPNGSGVLVQSQGGS